MNNCSYLQLAFVQKQMNRKKEIKPRKKPLQSRSRFTVDQILEAAAHIFARYGYAGTTTNRIAQKAGVSIGSLYQYYPNKDAILAALLEEHIGLTRSELTRALEKGITEGLSIEQILTQILDAMISVHADHTELHQVFISEIFHSTEITRRINDVKIEMIQMVEKLLHRYVEKSLPNARHSAYLIVHVVESLTHEYLKHPPEDMDQKTFVAETSALLFAYISSRSN